MSDTWNTIEVTSGDLKLIFLPGIGGRLWDVEFMDQSILFQNTDLIGRIPDLGKLELLPTRSPQFGFPLWGGEKTWIAPDSAWAEQVPYPVLDSGSYHVLSQGSSWIKLRSKICPISGIQIERCIKIIGSNSWSISHIATNRGSNQRLTGIWSVLMLDQPAQISMRTDDGATAKAIFGDPGDLVVSDGSSTVFNCTQAREYKSGIQNSSGLVLIHLTAHKPSLFLICDAPPALATENFAHGHNFEVFNSADYQYCEAEWHAPAQVLNPGDSTSFTQEFTIGLATGDIAAAQINRELIECISS